MATGFAIGEYATGNLAAPVKFGTVLLVTLQATFASGVATVDTVNSSPGVTLVKDTTGDYDVTFPKGTWVHFVGGSLDLADDTPTATAVKIVLPIGFVAAGTGKVLFANTDDGGLEDPADGTRVYLTLLVGTY
jgi:hypothetical protein